MLMRPFHPATVHTFWPSVTRIDLKALVQRRTGRITTVRSQRGHGGALLQRIPQSVYRSAISKSIPVTIQLLNRTRDLVRTHRARARGRGQIARVT